jgi:hypothetical protein
MTSQTTTSQTTTSRKRSDADHRSAVSDARDVARAAADEVRSALEGVGRSMPEVARVSRSLMDDASRAIERGSDERLSAGVTLSLGLAIGMLIGGAPRLLPILALVPVAAMGIVIVDRRSGGRRSTSATPT